MRKVPVHLMTLGEHPEELRPLFYAYGAGFEGRLAHPDVSRRGSYETACLALCLMQPRHLRVQHTQPVI